MQGNANYINFHHHFVLVYWTVFVFYVQILLFSKGTCFKLLVHSMVWVENLRNCQKSKSVLICSRNHSILDEFWG